MNELLRHRSAGTWEVTADMGCDPLSAVSLPPVQRRVVFAT